MLPGPTGKQQTIQLQAAQSMSPDTKKSNKNGAKFDKSDMNHLGASVGKNMNQSKQNIGFQAQMNLMDNGGKLQK